MTVRKAVEEDLASIYEIYKRAREYMRTHGNPEQWGDGYPPHWLIKEDKKRERLFVITEGGTIEAVFVFFIGDEEAYFNIDGSWSCSLPYGVVHRVASSGRIRNITKAIFDYCFTKTDYIRIDTHRDNTTMQNALSRYGFVFCGTVYYNRNNAVTERIAFDCRRSQNQ